MCEISENKFKKNLADYNLNYWTPLLLDESSFFVLWCDPIINMYT